MQENFSNIVGGEKLTLIDFYATWCGPCQTMHPVLEKLKNELGDGVRIFKLDVDKNEAFASQYRVQSVPTLMLFKNGELLWRQSGTMGVNDLKSIIAKFS